MKKKLMTRFNTLEWRSVDKDGIYVVFDMLGFKSVEDVVQLRVFELLNLNRINNNRAEDISKRVIRYRRTKQCQEKKREMCASITVMSD